MGLQHRPAARDHPRPVDGRRLQPQLGRQLHGHREHRARSRATFDEFCITVPNDSRLPNAGQQRCGFYDVKPAVTVGQPAARDQREGLGRQERQHRLPYRHWDGVWINARRPSAAQHRASAAASTSARTSTITASRSTCRTSRTTSPAPAAPRRGTASTPRAQGACHVVTSWMNNLDFRLNGSVPIKGGFTGSFIFRNTRGPR